MKNEPASSTAISEAALKVFSRDELTAMPKPQRLSLMGIIGRRLDKKGPPPTLEELQGIRELVTEHLWHPALGAFSQVDEGSETHQSEGSVSTRVCSADRARNQNEHG